MAADRDESEVRLMVPNDLVRVIDGVCLGTNTDRTNLVRQILGEWAEKKVHEATVLLRVARRNPSSKDGSGSGNGR